MATTKTRRQLIDSVLDSLGVLVPGQSPSDENVSRVDNILDPALDQIAGQGIYYAQDHGTSGPPTGGNFDNAVFLPLADMVAWAISGAFNLSNDPALKVKSDIAEAVLRQVSRPTRTRRTLSTDIMLRAGNRRYARFNYITGR